MVKKVIVIGMVLTLVLSLFACSDNSATKDKADYNDAANLLTEVKTTQFFTDDLIPDEDVEKILSAGVNAPSAMNTQPWHFTAVTDAEVAMKLADAMAAMKPPAMKKDDAGAPPVIPEGADKSGIPSDALKDAPTPPDGGAGFSKMPNKAGIGDAPLTIVISCKEGSDFDAGLAVQNMSAEAQLLGYGTKIMTAPTMALNNDEYKTMLSVPNEHKIVAVLTVGKAADENDNPDAVSSPTSRNAFDDMVTIMN